MTLLFAASIPRGPVESGVMSEGPADHTVPDSPHIEVYEVETTEYERWFRREFLTPVPVPEGYSMVLGLLHPEQANEPVYRRYKARKAARVFCQQVLKLALRAGPTGAAVADELAAEPDPYPLARGILSGPIAPGKFDPWGSMVAHELGHYTLMRPAEAAQSEHTSGAPKAGAMKPTPEELAHVAEKLKHDNLLLSHREVAIALNCSERTVTRMADPKQNHRTPLPPPNARGQWRSDDIRKHLERTGRQAPAAPWR